MELYCNRQAEGGRTLEVKDYEDLPIPDISKMEFERGEFDVEREFKIYSEEIKMEDRINFDKSVLQELMGDESLIDELYADFIKLADDRLYKARKRE